MTPWKILGVVAVIAGLVLALAQVLGWRRDARTLNHCIATLTAKHVPADVAGSCPAEIAADHLLAWQSLSCDQGLSASPERSVVVQASCTLPVRRVVAERDVARGEAARLTKALKDERLQRDDVVARAMAAAKTQAERKARAAAAVQAAPRDGDGLVVCDAECMRARWGAAGERQ